MRKLLELGAAAAVAAIGMVAAGQAALSAEKLVVAADVGFAPHIMAKPAGGFEGYNVDMVAEIARRLGTEHEIVDQEWSGIFAGLNAKKYDFVVAPTTVTAERAQEMLFMEGYLDTEYVFLVKKDAPDFTELDQLKGKIIAVNKGNVYDKWATERADQYGWTMQRYGKNADAIQAVLSGRADANLASGSVARWAAKQTPMLKTSVAVRTGQVFSSAFRLDDTELRNRVEEVVECMKLDGFFVELHEKWFGSPPSAGSASVTVETGYGPPGVKGYDPTYHRPNCG